MLTTAHLAMKHVPAPAVAAAPALVGVTPAATTDHGERAVIDPIHGHGITSTH